MQTFETIRDFSKRVSLPEQLVRAMTKQGQLSHIRSGARHVRIHVEAALQDLKKHSRQTACEIAERLPVPLQTRRSKPVEKKEKRPREKPRGRLPDSIRLANKQNKEEHNATTKD